MILSDKTLRQHLQQGTIAITPTWKQSDVRPAGLRLHLGNELLLPVGEATVDPSRAQKLEFTSVDLKKKSYPLKQGEFILASSLETIHTPRNIVCLLDGRSTLARLGLSLHCTAGVLDNLHGEARNIVLELKNLGPWSITLTYGLPIAMALFVQLTTEVEQEPHSQYAKQRGTVAPNLAFQTTEFHRQ